MKLVIISPEENHPSEIALYQDIYQHPKLEHIHIRKKNNCTINWLELEKFRHKLVVSQNLECPFDCLGKHGSSSNYSESTHSINEAEESKAQFCYLSPLYPSISKKGYKNIGLLNEVKQLYKIPKNWIALGGINQDHLRDLKQLGFSYAAVLGAVWTSENPTETAKKFLSTL